LDISSVKDAIHAISSALEIPAIIILILAVVVVLFQLGGVIVEFFVERLRKKPDVPRVLEELAMAKRDRLAMKAILEEHPFQRRQKRVFYRLLKRNALSSDEQRLLAVQLLADEETRLNKRVVVTDIIARIGPMFGLMATLIPLGPGLIALGQGDTHALADSLLTAFDATVAGLAAAGVAFIISKVRKRWYQGDLVTVEAVLEGMVQ
jgi:biopolymer transport protein ExbB/TolQ